MNQSGTPVVEALKEMGRYIILGVVAWLLAGGLEVLLGFFQASLSFEVRTLIVTLLTIVLRGIDKYLHLEGKESGNESYLGVKGITYL